MEQLGSMPIKDSIRREDAIFTYKKWVASLRA